MFTKTLPHIHALLNRKSLIVLFLTAWFLLISGAETDAQSEAFQEYQVKAVFLYNLTNFISWPDAAFENPQAPFSIAILGEDPFGLILDKVIQGETVKNREIVVERLTDLEELNPEKYQLLFVSASMQDRLAQIFNIVNESMLLTVSDMERFAHVGGMINLIRKENRVYLEINVDAAKRAGLSISSKLLKLAKIVKSDH